MIGEITKFQISHAYTIRELNPISLCLCRIILFSCFLTRLITSNSSIVSLFIPENKLKNINLDDEKIHFKEIIQNRIDEEFEIISTQLNISKEYAIYYARLFFYRLKMENEERKLDFDFMKKQIGKQNRYNFEKIISILQNEYHSKIMNTLKEIKEKENKILESLIPLEVLPNKLDLSFDNTSNQFNDFRNQTQFPLVKIYLNHQEEFSIFTSFPGFLFFSNQIISLNINKDKPIGFHYLYQSLKIQTNINSDILSKSFEDFQVIWNYISNKISKRFFTNSFTDVIFPEITEEKVDIGKQKDVINFIYGIIKYIIRFNNTIIDEIFQEKEEIQFNDILLNFPLPEDLSKNIENISSVFHLDYSEIYFFISKNKINLSNVEIFEKFLESKISSFSSTLTKIDADSLDPSLDPFQNRNIKKSLKLLNKIIIQEKIPKQKWIQISEELKANSGFSRMLHFIEIFISSFVSMQNSSKKSKEDQNKIINEQVMKFSRNILKLSDIIQDFSYVYSCSSTFTSQVLIKNVSDIYHKLDKVINDPLKLKSTKFYEKITNHQKSKLKSFITKVNKIILLKGWKRLILDLKDNKDENQKLKKVLIKKLSKYKGTKTTRNQINKYFPQKILLKHIYEAYQYCKQL
ncbi:hypothetical protein M0811_00605 [Anaeramoeba ignava]|uniref:Uncharacterized protein n=1 Tax=Anaeramoeba ignava TaxID=1746090 RepID=A0A9Q0LU29_ANAIG|nr:hypothetical protein M0811_00605 [Anaeramoeba ignava]